MRNHEIAARSQLLFGDFFFFYVPPRADFRKLCNFYMSNMSDHSASRTAAHPAHQAHHRLGPAPTGKFSAAAPPASCDYSTLSMPSASTAAVTIQKGWRASRKAPYSGADRRAHHRAATLIQESFRRHTLHSRARTALEAAPGAVAGTARPPALRRQSTASHRWWALSMVMPTLVQERRHRQRAEALARAPATTSTGDGDGALAAKARWRTLSLVLQWPRLIVPTYYCQICMCNEPLKDGVALPGCGHVFCADCILPYVTSKISDAQVHDVPLRCVVHTPPQAVHAPPRAVDAPHTPSIFGG